MLCIPDMFFQSLQSSILLSQTSLGPSIAHITRKRRADRKSEQALDKDQSVCCWKRYVTFRVDNVMLRESLNCFT